jgi:hypothetical protein
MTLDGFTGQVKQELRRWFDREADAPHARENCGDWP